MLNKLKIKIEIKNGASHCGDPVGNQLNMKHVASGLRTETQRINCCDV